MDQLHILHAKHETPLAEALARWLDRKEGYSTTWDGQHGELAAMSGRTLDRAHQSTCLILWSRTSITAKWTIEAAEDALKRGKLVELVVDPVPSPIEDTKVAPLDFTHWNGETDTNLWKSLVAMIKTAAGRPTGEHMPAKEQLGPVAGTTGLAAAAVVGLMMAGPTGAHLQAAPFAQSAQDVAAANISPDVVGGDAIPRAHVPEPASAPLALPTLTANVTTRWQKLDSVPALKVDVHEFASDGTTDVASSGPDTHGVAQLVDAPDRTTP